MKIGIKNHLIKSVHYREGLTVYKRLLHYALPYWKVFMLSVLGMFVYAGLEPAMAALMKPLIDGSFIENNPAMMQKAPLLLLGLFLVLGVASFASSYFSGWVGRKVIADLRRDLFEQLLHLPSAYYDKASSGQLLAKLLYNSEQVATATTKVVVSVIRDGLTIIGLLLLMLYLNPLLSLIFIVVGPLLGYCTNYVTKRFRKLSKRIQESVGNLGHVAQETIEAHRIIKVFGGKEHEMRRFDKENEKNQQRQMKMVATDAISGPVIQFIYASAFAVIIYLMSLESIREQITLGTFISFITAMAMLFRPIKRLTTVNSLLQKGIAAGESIFELLDMEREQDKGRLELPRVDGGIEYKNVCLTYEGRGNKALVDINLRIEAGKTIALVGHSGGGKTSLVRLLPRLYDVTSGEITIDGQNIKNLTLANLRCHIAYVGQEITLFNDTVANNIAYGSLAPPSFEAIKAATEAAHALEFIEKLPNGFATVLGQQGLVLSGGQRQRIAIARALLKDAPILILDEATSALDSESERHIQQALELLMQNRTTLVIAHRLSTVENADRIYVLHGGRIVEQGTHDQLIRANKYYAELYRLQFSHHGLTAPNRQALAEMV